MIPQSEEKIRYAKWKAADIAKAFREGRKPYPGPAGSGSEPDFSPAMSTSLGSPPPTNSSPPSSGAPLPSNSNAPVARRRSPPSSPPARKVSPKRTSSPPHMNSSDIARANHDPREFRPKTPPRPGVSVTDEVSSPGSWSTAATPGTDDRTKGTNGFDYEEQNSPTRTTKGRGSSRLKNAWVSGELENGSDESDEGGVGVSGTVPQKRTVRFTPSVTGGLTPPITPDQGDPTYPFVSVQTDAQILPIAQSPPLTDGHQRRPSISSGTNSPPKHNRTTLSSSPPRAVPSTPPVAPFVPSYQASAPPLPYHPVTFSPPSPPLPPPPAVSPPDLTPQLIAKAQKHCRFAISALDYEDAAQARKELRAALAVLGG